MSDREELERLYRRACDRLDASRLAVRVSERLPASTFVMGLGKLAHAQVRAVLSSRSDFRALVSVSTEGGAEAWALEGDHPVPGEKSFIAGEKLVEAARAADGASIAFFVSGGGSALAAMTADGVDEWEKIRASRVLLRSGLDIERLNVVRKAMSAIKGGRLARLAPKASWRVFVTSDVVGDDFGTIASGPCFQDVSRPGEALRLCREAGIWDELPPGVRRRLSSREGPPSLADIDVTHTLLGSARDLARAVEADSAWPTTVLAPVTETVDALAQRYTRWLEDRVGGGPALLVATGEPTLRVTGDGEGGRAQHLALLMAKSLRGLDATFLAAGTDGRDGPTEHAGAVVDGNTADAAGPQLSMSLSRFDSASLHAALGTAIPRWAPVTHVGELHLLLVR